jgi:hypothetical protein
VLFMKCLCETPKRNNEQSEPACFSRAKATPFARGSKQPLGLACRKGRRPFQPIENMPLLEKRGGLTRTACGSATFPDLMSAQTVPQGPRRELEMRLAARFAPVDRGPSSTGDCPPPSRSKAVPW